MSKEQSTPVTLDMAVLQEMMLAILREAKKPADPTPEQLAALENAQNMRKEQAELILLQLENKKREQEACIHMRRDNTTTGVYVENGNYIICQQCQKIIRPEAEPQLFSRLYQLGQSPAVFS